MTFIDLQELQTELNKTKGTLDKLVARMGHAADNCKQNHKHNIKAYGDELSALQEQYKQVDRLAQQVQQRIAADDTEAKTLQSVAASLQAEKQVLQRRLAQMQQGHETQGMACERLEAELSKREAEQLGRVSALDKVLHLYEHALGMELVAGEDEMIVAFTQIDPADPSRRFAFAVKVQGDNTYEVTRCDPVVDGMAQLTQQLQQDNNFAGFVKSMRTEFKRTVGA